MINSSDIKYIRNTIKKRLVSLSNEFYFHEEQRDNIYQILVRSIELGECNSAIVLGPHGCGKSTLIRNVLNELQDTDDFENKALIIHLSGFLHTSDELALISILEELKIDIGDESKRNEVDISFLREAMRRGLSKCDKTVIFILEEFDMFCEHQNQALLYNLFDAIQNGEKPMCVIGVTSHLDIVDQLEKRVASRFSKRQYLISPGSIPDLLKKYIHLFIQWFTIPKSHSSSKLWNKQIEELFRNEKVVKTLRNYLIYNNTLKYFKNILYEVIINLTEDHPTLEIEDFLNLSNSPSNDPIVNTVLGLSILEISLIISMKHHVEIYDSGHFNFEMIANRIEKFQRDNSSIQTANRSVMLKAFQHLEYIHLVESVLVRSQLPEYQMYKLMIPTWKITRIVQSYQNLPTELAQWVTFSSQ